ncbi:MAG: sensor histidine kinase [Dehalococcoidia bacterium]|nr:Sensor kinase CusS [Chloroflexota bacterium]MBT9160611.1 Sensor kinase CusS [Chloroflexota bacterium]MBT9163354.1 Sensor kinase CusS [Chloroflexota bacterium]
MKQWLFLSQYVRRRLTLRVRLALWVMGLLLVLSIGLLASFTLITPILVVRPVNAAEEVPLSRMIPDFLPPEPELPATPPSMMPRRIPAEPPVPIGPPAAPPPITADEVAAIQAHIRHQMSIISLIGLGLIVSLGGVGSYWLAGRALRPVQKLAQAAQGIDAKTLDTRLSLMGPADELTQLAGTFDAMLDRLEAAFEQQGRFVADAAHELRTPLTTLRASVDIVSADPNATIEDYRAISATLARALTRLQRLVDDLLLLATEEHIPLDAAIAIEPILEDVLLDLKPLASEHSVTLRLMGTDDLTARGDSVLLARVFHNLIENGVRYNRQGGEVIVNTYGEGEWVVVTVADTGTGIAGEEQSRIFDRFYRVDRSRSRHGGGAGLGLSIARHIVQLHGGQLEVQSIVGIGSTFMVKLPRSSGGFSP